MPKLLQVLLILFCLWPTLSCAQGESYGANPAALALVEQLVAEEGYPREELLAVMNDAHRQDSILEAIARPAEKAKPWYEYREIFLTPQRVREGVAFYRQNREVLERAQQATGVPAQIVVAILGVESFYGRIAGNYRVLDALATLAFDYPPRSEFFTAELKHFLILTREEGLDPRTLKGSYAGAMGYGQFMPSSYRSYAVDFDADGTADIWNSPADAIGSVANYFKGHGWTSGAAVAVPAVASGEMPAGMLSEGRDLQPRFTVGEFIAAGLKPQTPIDPTEEAIGIKFELADGNEYWLGLHNFYVITRYNHSAKYAMSVYQLSQLIAAGAQN